MRGICPNCEKDTELKEVSLVEDISIRGDAIPTAVMYFKCTECGAELRDPRGGVDPLDLAYTEYRRRHGMLQPEEIKELRNQYGLTQQTSPASWVGAVQP